MASPSVPADDLALDRVLAIGVAAFPLTTLSSGSRRLLTALAANAASNTCIRDELGDVMAVTFVTPAPSTSPYLTEAGKSRMELEFCNSPGK